MRDTFKYVSLSYSSLAQSVGDREKQLSVVFRREIAKIRSFEAEQAQAHKTTIFSGVSMKNALGRQSKVINTDQKFVIFLLSSVGSGSDTLYTNELWGDTNKKDTDLRSESSYSSLAQSVERMTVNHDVAGSSPAGGAKNTPKT